VARKSYAVGGAGSWSNRKTAIALDFVDQRLGGADRDKNLWHEPAARLSRIFQPS
jgi:hypothetical protein